MHNCLLFILGFIPIVSTAQVLCSPEHKVPLQTTTYSKNQSEAVSFSSNPAALASFKKCALGIYSERKFMLQELSLFTLSAVVPTSSGNFGIAARQFGYSNYSQSEFGLAYGHSLGEKAAIGAQFNYNTYKVNGYGNAAFLSIDAGALFQFTNQLRAGFHIYKPAEMEDEKNGDQSMSSKSLPSIYEVGFGYDASDQLFLTAIASKQDSRNVEVNAAIQYKFADKFLCKAGIVSGTSSFYVGGGVQLSAFRIDAITSVHPNLGLTPGVMLLFHLPDKQ